MPLEELEEMPNLVSKSGLWYLKDLRNPKKEDDPEARRIAIELPEVPFIAEKNNPCKWDLVFICKDGVVFGHRLVIANASKLIMSMMNDQPQGETSYIDVLDFPRFIVQLLVDLAYTGEMRIEEEIQSDVFDAMSTLGWVNTDCLASFYDGIGDSYVGREKSPEKEEKGRKVSSTSAGMNVVQPKSPRPSRIEAYGGFDDDEDAMEIADLPEVAVSDDESKRGSNKTKEETTAGRKGRAKTAKKQETEAKNNIEKNGQSSKRVGRKNGKGEDKADTDDVKPSEENATAVQGRRGKRALPVDEAPTVSSSTSDVKNIDETSQEPSTVDADTSLDSPSKRQRRKPKRFEEYEELDKPKPRTPVKAAEQTTAKGKQKAIGNSDNSKSNSKATNAAKKSDDSSSKKNSLITSYFSKTNHDDGQMNEEENDEDSLLAPESPSATGSGPKIRSFDEILASSASHIGEENTEAVTNGETSDSAVKPQRRSSRVSSTAHSTEGSTENNDEEILPARKKSRKDSTDTVSSKVSGSSIRSSSRRLSKQ